MFCQSCGANVADGTAFCSACGRPMVGYSVGPSSAPPGAPVAGAVSPAPVPGAVSASPAAVSVVYAGFWLRFVAALLDWVILAVPSRLLALVMIGSAMPFILQNRQNPDPAMLFATILPRLFFFVLVSSAGQWLYFSLMESSSWQATLGKKALGIYVTDLDGNRISFGRATGRYFSKIISGLTLLIGYIMAGFTEKKQALHDMIAGCLVLRKS